MAASFWRTVLALQVALAILLALVVSGFVPGISLWRLTAIAIVAFIAIQYLLVALTIVLVRQLAKPVASGGMRQIARVALSEPVYFGLAELAMAIAPLPCTRQAGRGTRSPVLLIHGLACNRGVWRWLIPRLRAAGFDCIHAVDLEPLRCEIDDLVRRIEREVLDICAHEKARITIVAHSMGGLIARAALRSLDPEKVGHLVTIGTPHHGAALARVVRYVPAQQICTGASWLAALNAAQEGHLPVSVTSIYSSEDNLAGPASVLEGARIHELRGLGHFGLLISRRATDCVVRALQEAT